MTINKKYNRSGMDVECSFEASKERNFKKFKITFNIYMKDCKDEERFNKKRRQIIILCNHIEQNKSIT